MVIYIPTPSTELSQRKLEEFEQFSRIVNAGRQNPIWFSNYFFGIELMDYQRWVFMESWDKPYALWLQSRGSGKTTLAATFLMTKMLLIPDYKVYISTNSAAQSVEVFKKLEDIALQRIPSFSSATDLFAAEVMKSPNNDTGFVHNPAGHTFRLYNNSELTTLSTNINAIRGKRGSVFYDECSWQTAEQMAATEHFADLDASFTLGTESVKYIRPKTMPLQLLYASSAGDVEYPFYEKYRLFAKKMIMGDPNYFVCDLDAYAVKDHSSVNGIPIRSHLTQEAIDKAIEDDPDAAERELFNRFRKGGGENAVVSMDTLIRNSQLRKPLLLNETGKMKFIFCYDPARNFDGSILSIWRLVDDKQYGYMLYLENTISMVDTANAKKTPLPMPEQLEIIRETMLAYNGERAAEWENIEFYIDAGAGGGGVSAVADQLMDDWVDKQGVKHRGIIDPDHKQYETARKKYTGAMPIVHLVEPRAFRNVIFDALGKMTKLNLMKFTDYDGHDSITIESDNGELNEVTLSFDEKLALTQNNLLKNEVSYMCRYDTQNGGVTFDLARDKRNTMHDDRCFTAGLAAFALASKRREDLITKPKAEGKHTMFTFRPPKLGTRR